MKKSEVIELNREKIAEAMREDYRAVLQAKGRTQYKLYIWEDGELDELYDVQGSNGWLQAKDWEERKLYYVTTVDYPYFDPWDCTVEAAPEDDAEREKAQEDIIDWMCEEYDADAIIDVAIINAKEEESMEQR